MVLEISLIHWITFDALAATAALVHADPLLVQTFPLVLGATDAIALVPLPTNTLLAV